MQPFRDHFLYTEDKKNALSHVQVCKFYFGKCLLFTVVLGSKLYHDVWFKKQKLFTFLIQYF